MKLTNEQARQLEVSVRRHLGFLNRLQERLKATGVVDEQLHREVTIARDAVIALAMTLHYRGCDGGVGCRVLNCSGKLGEWIAFKGSASS